MPDADWTDLHDLALVYVALLHGTHGTGAQGERSSFVSKDEALPPSLAEAARHLAALGVQHREGDLHRIVRAAFLMYVGATGRSMLDVAVVSLRRVLPRARRLTVLDDLAGLAAAGEHDLEASELSFIQYLAVRWDLGPKQERGE